LKGFLKTVLPAPAAHALRRLYWRIKGDVYSEEDFRRLLARRTKDLPRVSGGPLISILCCSWNTPEEYLRAMLDSIRGQSHQRWELLIGNCSDGEHPAVGGILREAALNDARIKVFELPNRGIAANTNAVFEHASGEFVMLMDHDDLLMPDALEQLAGAQRREDSDFVYADEYVLQMEFRRIWRCRKKPFTMEALESDNFINHPVLIRRGLFESVGGFREGFEGSQDHDLYFRLLEKTDRISYVDAPLYVWRINPGSFSNRNLDRCIESGKKAVAEHLKRTGRSGTVVSVGRTTVYLIVDKRPAGPADPEKPRP
jgi:glycosyltransferase involved in cell wall biosynthesis